MRHSHDNEMCSVEINNVEMSVFSWRVLGRVSGTASEKWIEITTCDHAV